MFRVINSNTCNVRVRVRVHGHLLNYTVEDEDEDDSGGSLLHSRARHEPTQKNRKYYTNNYSNYTCN